MSRKLKLGSLFDGNEWKPIDGFENEYLISSGWDVYSIRTKKVLKPKINHTGYYRVHLSAHGTHKYCSIHRLVANAFIPNEYNKPTVNHKNENKTDNRVENLEWMTAKEQNASGYNSRFETTRSRQRM